MLCTPKTHIQQLNRNDLLAKILDCETNILSNFYSAILISGLGCVCSEIKTVSVWFQNKRQKGHLSASSSSSSDIDGIKRISLPPRTTPIRKRVQSPLPHDEDAVRPHLSPMAAYDRTVDKSASREINIFAKCQPKIHKSLDEVAIPADELWKHLLSSPPTVSEMSDIDADDEDAANILVNFFANDQKAVNKRSLILEWACDRQSKKRKGDRGDPTNDTMPDAATEICLRCLQPRRLDSSLAKRMSLPTTTVHPSEDVMHAVSLLLCFKYAAQISLR